MTMKKLIICLIMATITFSCSLTNESTPVDTQELLPIENIDIPEEFELGQTYEIAITYLRPTTCHAFNDIYYLKQGNERTVAVVSTIFSSNGNCEALTDTVLGATFDFEATEPGSYVFKFWKGKDSEGQDTYLTVEVPVN
jgi:hypothetical protein